MHSPSNREHVVVEAARAGAGVAAEQFRRDLPVETKSGATDVVTEADRAAQRAVIDRIRESFPDDAVVGEEDEELKAVPDEGAAWLIDPIDGTNNYIREVGIWTTSVAAVVDGEPVAAANVLPVLGDTYTTDADGAYRNGEPIAVSEVSVPHEATVTPAMWWGLDRRDEYARACTAVVERFADMRRYGSTQAVLSLVADGGLDAAVTNVQADPWDTVAGVHLIRQAGGTVTDLNGDRWRHDSQGFVASNGRIHEEALAAARAIDDAKQ